MPACEEHLRLPPRATVLRCFDGGTPQRRSLGFQGVYGINVSLCYWTVARYETPNPARRGYCLDNAEHRGRPAQHRACMDGRLAIPCTRGRSEWVRTERTEGTVVCDGIHIVGPLHLNRRVRGRPAQ